VTGDFAGEQVIAVRSWKTAAIAAVALVLGGAGTLWMQSAGVGRLTRITGLGSTSSAAENSIAVVPLATIGDDGAARTLALGATSEVINAVARVPGFRVTSRAPTATIDSEPLSRTAATAPRVAYLVEGTVQHERDRFRIAIRLVHVPNDSTVWADRFEGAADSTFALQDAVARGTASALAAQLPVLQRR
jgi:TolB-like protein